MFLTPSNFVGKFELHKGMYSQPNLVDYIDRYERKYLIDLFGAKLFDLLDKQWLHPLPNGLLCKH